MGEPTSSPDTKIELDRNAFSTSIRLKALRIPKSKCQPLMTALRGHTFQRPRLRTLVDDPSGRTDTKLLLLNETLADGSAPDGLQGVVDSSTDNAPCTSASVVQGVVEREGLEMVDYELHVDYSYWSMHHVLQKILPAGSEIPTSFETVGHLAHLNLRDDMLPYRYVIGQVVLDKNPHLKTVVNKVGTIQNEYRVFSMEVVAGEDRMETEVKQQGLRFRMDYSKVYWNSRLEAEHKRLVGVFDEGQVVVDAMAGVGPFAVPAAKKGCTVYANDLNPDSYKWLNENVRINKVGSRVHTFQMDGGAFIRMMCGGRREEATGTQDGEDATTPCSTAPEAPVPSTNGTAPALPSSFHHVVMNLPASAVEFLGAFNGAFDATQWTDSTALPWVHCYTFKTADQSESDVISRAESYLGGSLGPDYSCHVVRSVAPNKDMLCLSFKITPQVAFNSNQQQQQQQQQHRNPEVATGTAQDTQDMDRKRQKTV